MAAGRAPFPGLARRGQPRTGKRAAHLHQSTARRRAPACQSSVLARLAAWLRNRVRICWCSLKRAARSPQSSRSKGCASARRLPQRGCLATPRRKAQPSTMGRALAARAGTRAAEAAFMALKSTGPLPVSHFRPYCMVKQNRPPRPPLGLGSPSALARFAVQARFSSLCAALALPPRRTRATFNASAANEAHHHCIQRPEAVPQHGFWLADLWHAVHREGQF